MLLQKLVKSCYLIRFYKLSGGRKLHGCVSLWPGCRISSLHALAQVLDGLLVPPQQRKAAEERKSTAIQILHRTSGQEAITTLATCSHCNTAGIRIVTRPLSGLVTFTTCHCKYGRAFSFTLCVFCTFIISCSLTSKERMMDVQIREPFQLRTSTTFSII